MNLAPKQSHYGKAFAFASLLLTPSILMAHPGHGEMQSFSDGMLHFFTGWDHVLTAALAGLLITSNRHIGSRGSLLGALVVPAILSNLLHSAASGTLWTASIGLWIAGTFVLSATYFLRQSKFQINDNTAYLKRASIGFAILGLALIQL